MKVRFLASATADLDDIYLEVAIHDENAADRLVERLRLSTRRLANFPESAPPRPDVASDVRGLSFANHIIFYRLIKGEVQIVRIIRASRDLSTISL